MYAYCISVYVYSKYISNYINKHTSKDNDNISGRRFCAVLAVSIYKYCDIAASLAACLVSLYCAVADLAGGAFGLVSLYSARNGQSAPRIAGRVAAGGVSARVGVSFVAGGAAYPPHPTPKTRPRNLGCLFQKIFFEIFFIFLHL